MHAPFEPARRTSRPRQLGDGTATSGGGASPSFQDSYQHCLRGRISGGAPPATTRSLTASRRGRSGAPSRPPPCMGALWRRCPQTLLRSKPFGPCPPPPLPINQGGRASAGMAIPDGSTAQRILGPAPPCSPVPLIPCLEPLVRAHVGAATASPDDPATRRRRYPAPPPRAPHPLASPAPLDHHAIREPAGRARAAQAGAAPAPLPIVAAASAPCPWPPLGPAALTHGAHGRRTRKPSRWCRRRAAWPTPCFLGPPVALIRAPCAPTHLRGDRSRDLCRVAPACSRPLVNCHLIICHHTPLMASARRRRRPLDQHSSPCQTRRARRPPQHCAARRAPSRPRTHLRAL